MISNFSQLWESGIFLCDLGLKGQVLLRSQSTHRVVWHLGHTLTSTEEGIPTLKRKSCFLPWVTLWNGQLVLMQTLVNI